MPILCALLEGCMTRINALLVYGLNRWEILFGKFSNVSQGHVLGQLREAKHSSAGKPGFPGLLNINPVAIARRSGTDDKYQVRFVLVTQLVSITCGHMYTFTRLKPVDYAA